MRLALLGSDPQTLALLAAAVDRGDEIVAIVEADSDAATLEALAPRARRGETWESLLVAGTADAVLVARGENEDLRAEQLRKLVQAGVPILASHPLFDSMLVYYELDMIRRDTGCIMLPYLPGRLHPAVQTLARLAQPNAADSFGPLEQVVMERALPDRGRPSVTAQFARDMDLARSLCGELTKVSGMAPPGEEARYASLGVQLTGAGGSLVRWSVSPVRNAAGGTMALLAARGKAVLHVSADDAQAWRLDISPGAGGTARVETYPEWDPAGVALAQLERALSGEAARPDWTDAARSVELAEAMDRSLAKGRTVELYYEEHSEETTFKGTMTSLGCGLLIVGLLTLVIAAVAGVHGYWLYALLAVCVVFLLLQSLRLVFPRGKSPSSEREGTGATD